MSAKDDAVEAMRDANFLLVECPHPYSELTMVPADEGRQIKIVMHERTGIIRIGAIVRNYREAELYFLGFRDGALAQFDLDRRRHARQLEILNNALLEAAKENQS